MHNQTGQDPMIGRRVVSEVGGCCEHCRLDIEWLPEPNHIDTLPLLRS